VKKKGRGVRRHAEKPRLRGGRGDPPEGAFKDGWEKRRKWRTLKVSGKKKNRVLENEPNDKKKKQYAKKIKYQESYR